MKLKIMVTLIASLLMLMACSPDDETPPIGGLPSNQVALSNTVWVYHYEGDQEVYGEVIHSEIDYTLTFLSDTNGTYLVDNLDGNSYTWQFSYTCDLNGNGTLYYQRPEGIPDYMFQPEQPFTYDQTIPSITFIITGNDEWEAEHGRMVFLKKQINNNSN